MAVYAYVRASTQRQVDDGETLGVQERMIAGYAMMHGLTITNTFIERAVSGGSAFLERPAAGEMVAVLRPGDVVICAKLDRAFRSSRDALNTLETFRGAGWDLHLLDLGGSVIKSGVAELIFTMLAAAAQFERHRIKERIMDVKSDQKERGSFLGGHRPLGWLVGEDGMLIAIPEEQAARSRIFQLRAGGASLRRIAEVISAEGFPISHSGVDRILRGGSEAASVALTEAGV